MTLFHSQSRVFWTVWEQNVHQFTDVVYFLNRQVTASSYTHTHIHTHPYVHSMYVSVPTLCLFFSLPLTPSRAPSFSREESDAEVLHFCLCKCLSEVQLRKISTATLVLKQRAVQHGNLMTGHIIYQITGARMFSGFEYRSKCEEKSEDLMRVRTLTW